jgi:hypothetical protein
MQKHNEQRRHGRDVAGSPTAVTYWHPGLSIRGGYSDLTDHGVDEDDGAVDGWGQNGVWRYLPLVNNPIDPWTFEITFQPNEAGEYPTYAGLALVGCTTISVPLGTVYSLWRAFDPHGNPLSPEPLRVDRLPLKDHHYYNTKADQFVGLYNEGGIGKIFVGRQAILDHVQHGWAIPEPSSVAFVAGSGALLVLRRRRRKRLRES